jgi:hypothetical protein
MTEFKRKIGFIFLGVAPLVFILVSLCIGRYPISLSEVIIELWKGLVNHKIALNDTAGLHFRGYLKIPL